jgi:hypothetical protein
MGAPVVSGTLAGSTSGSWDSIHKEAASGDFSGRTARTTPPDRRAAAVVEHDFRNREQQQRKIGDTGVSRFVRSSNAGVGAGDCSARGSDSDVRLQPAADRGASKHFDDSRNRGIAGRPMRPVTALHRRPHEDAHLWRFARPVQGRGLRPALAARQARRHFARAASSTEPTAGPDALSSSGASVLGSREVGERGCFAVSEIVWTLLSRGRGIGKHALQRFRAAASRGSTFAEPRTAAMCRARRRGYDQNSSQA